MSEINPKAPVDSSGMVVAEMAKSRAHRANKPAFMRWLKPLASLKLTVALLVLGVGMTWVASLQQTRADIWQIKKQHFYSPVVFVPLDTFFVPAWTPELNQLASKEVFGNKIHLPLPSGASIMFLMMINLLAAHTVRFRVKARGWELLSGIIVFLLGAFLTTMVVMNGQNAKGFQAEPVFSWKQLWIAVQIGLATVFLSSILGIFRLVSLRRSQTNFGGMAEIVMLSLLAVVLAVTLVFLLLKGESSFIGDSAMRILWQLIQGGVASIVMLVGCHFIFGRKSGIVILHLGLVLLMLGEFFVTYTAIETRMLLYEGDEVSYAFDIRDFEMAVMSEADQEGRENIVAVPGSLLMKQREINDANLPFKIKPLRYFRNSSLTKLTDGQTSLANRGVGTVYAAVEDAVNTGTSANQVADYASVYVDLIDKQENKSLGIYLLSQVAYENERTMLDEVTVNGKTYRIGLRFTHYFKPYTIKLHDTERKNYPGTLVPKEYYSEFQVIHPGLNLDVRKKTWMNNPVRFGNETFYQAGHDFNQGREYSVLQIVKNTGWMIPYICCMMVSIGLLAQFGQTLLKFLNREPRQAGQNIAMGIGAILGFNFFVTGETSVPPAERQSNRSKWCVLAIVLLIWSVIGYSFYRTSKPKVIEKDEIRLDLFGQIPIAFGGRIQPLESLAKNLVKGVSKGGAVQFKSDYTGMLLEPSTKDLLKLSDKQIDEIQEIRIEVMRKSQELFQVNANGQIFQDSQKLERLEKELKDFEKQRVSSSLLPAQMKQLEKLMSEKRKPIRWLADFLFDDKNGGTYYLFKIVDRDVKQALNLPRRKGHRYTFDEVQAAEEKIRQIIDEGSLETKRAQSSEQLTNFERNILEINDTVQLCMQIKYAFDNTIVREVLSDMDCVALARSLDEASNIPLLTGPRSTQEDWKTLNSAITTNWLLQTAEQQKITTGSQLASLLTDQYIAEHVRPRLEKRQIVFILSQNEEMKKIFVEQFPDRSEDDLAAWISAQLDRDKDQTNEIIQGIKESIKPMIDSLAEVQHKEILPAVNSHITALLKLKSDKLDSGFKQSPSVDLLKNMPTSYRDNDAASFNSAVESYLSVLYEQPPRSYSAGRLKTESWMNRAGPFYFPMVIYLLAFILSIVAWLGLRKPLNQVAFAMIIAALAIHTIGLVARIYVSGRPPITSLYSTALFISWGSVIFFLVVERFLRIGIGNLLAGMFGYLVLLVAMNLGVEEMDTMSVLRAVLDTQFWLSTHVVIISLGYSSTLAAGCLGMAYIIGGVFSPAMTAHLRRELGRMIYGITCFSLFFSFVGTVLGGLWADDSWGRFWGWDVKENGALMIVLCNAILLHARWAGMIKDRGLAVLSLFSNIVVVWSWFAVNELGVGLHAYALTEGKMFWVGLFWFSQLSLMALGAFWPLRLWLSHYFENRDMLS